MRKLHLTFVLIIGMAHFAAAESHPGYRHPALFSEEETASDNPDFSTIFARLADETLTIRDVAIRYEIKTRKVVGALWMTKGNFEFQLPTKGLLVPRRPAGETKVSLLLSVEKISDVQKQRITLLGVHWGDGSK